MIDDKQTGRFGAAPPAPAPSGAMQAPKLAKVLGLLRGLTGFAGLISLGVLAGEAVMPMPYKPSTLIGAFHGNLEAADARAKLEATTELARRHAEAAAQPPAFAAMEGEAFRMQQQVLANALQMQSALANGGDAACIAGQLIPRSSRDYGWLGELLRGGCGVGDAVRQDMLNTLRRAGQENSVLIPRPRAAEPSVGAAPRAGAASQ